MLAIKRPPPKIIKPAFYGMSEEELEKIKQERLKRIKYFHKIEQIYYPY
mgnify:CR=1 FL=1